MFTSQISGILGLGSVAKLHPSADTFLGAWLQRNPQAEKVSVGFALNRPETSNATTNSGNSTTNSPQLDAGEMHMLVPDMTSYDGDIVNVEISSYSSTNGPIYGNGGGQQMQAAGWMAKLDQWSFLNQNGDRVDGGNGAIAAVDPWYSAIIMPRKESESICESRNRSPYGMNIKADAANPVAKIPGSQLTSSSNTTQQIWNVPCDTRVNLTISIAGIDFNIDPRDLIIQGDIDGSTLQKRQDAMCPCAVQGWSDATVPGYMLGSAFMWNAYV